mgnify:CR=1 FL=1
MLFILTPSLHIYRPLPCQLLSAADQRIDQTAAQRDKHESDDHHFHNSHYLIPPLLHLSSACRLCLTLPSGNQDGLPLLSVFIPDSAEKTDHNKHDRHNGPDVHLHYGLLLLRQLYPLLSFLREHRLIMSFTIAYTAYFLQFISPFLTYL